MKNCEFVTFISVFQAYLATWCTAPIVNDTLSFVEISSKYSVYHIKIDAT